MSARVAGRQARTRHACRTVLCALLFFAVGQLTILWLIDHRFLELRDMKYGWKLVRLRRLINREHPGSLVMMLGSSRTAYGFKPDVFCERLAEQGCTPTAFNMGVGGAGPVRQLLCLRQALRRGFKPTFMFIEVFPLMFNEPRKAVFNEEIYLEHFMFEQPDCIEVSPLLSHAKPLLKEWRLARWTPWHSNRFLIMGRILRNWLPGNTEPHLPEFLQRMDSSGWSRPPDTAGPCVGAKRSAMLAQWQLYKKSLPSFKLSESATSALEETLDLCAAHDIKTALVLMPEASELRAWYGPGIQQQLQPYLARLTGRYGVPMIDASAWVADEGFWDVHHLLVPGATHFSRRLADEAAPLLRKHHRVAEAQGP